MIGLWLLACRGFDVETESLTLQCEAAELEADSEVQWVKSGADVLVWRSSVYMPSDAVFTPELSIEDDRIDLREYWDTSDGDATVCFNPTLRLIDPAFDSAELWWFIGDEEISVDIAELELE